MTGEMAWIRPDGEDSNGDQYPLHAHLARELECELRPFDVYIGPYIEHPNGKIFIESEDGFSGRLTLWPGGLAPAFREPLTEGFATFEDLVPAARAMCASAGVAQR